MTAPRLPLTAVANPDWSFARSMKALRLARRWSMERLAAEAGITEGTVFNLEAGRNGPNLRTAWRVAEAFGVSMDAMVRGEVPGDLRGAAS